MIIAVCDDEKDILDNNIFMINRILEKYQYECECEGFTDGRVLLDNALKKHIHYDIYILDINLITMSGLDMARKIREVQKDSLIIFLTNYDKFAIEAFDVHAFNYILKPISEESFEIQLEECLNYLEEKKVLYYFKYNRSIMSVHYNHIYYFESQKRKVKIITYDSEYEYYDTLKDVAKKIGENIFVRVHTSYVVNMEHIRRFNGNKITLDNKMEIPVSKKYSNHFNKQYMRYIRKRSF